MKSMKAYILGAVIISLSIIIIGISASYAYFINTVEEVNSGNQGVSVTSGALTMNFTTSQYINASAANLVEDANVLTSGDYTAFSVVFPNDSTVANATYSLYLTDTTISSNFKSAYLKWALYSGSNTTPTASGNFNNVTCGGTTCTGTTYSVDDITLLNAVSITKGTTTNYKLYVWLSYDANTQQNSLLNGSLSTKVAFRAVSN